MSIMTGRWLPALRSNLALSLCTMSNEDKEGDW